MEQEHELEADLRRVENWSELTWWETMVNPSRASQLKEGVRENCFSEMKRMGGLGQVWVI